MQPNRKLNQDNFVWISYADLTTTLMFTFILLFLVFYVSNEHQKQELNAKNEELVKVSGSAPIKVQQVESARRSLIEDLNRVTKYMNTSAPDCMNAIWEVNDKENAIRVTFRTVTSREFLYHIQC